MAGMADGRDLLLARDHREVRDYKQFERRQIVTPSDYHALRGLKVRIVWVSQWAPASEDYAKFRQILKMTNPDVIFAPVEDWQPETTPLEDKHEPNEATGGYIECSCGWPNKEQFYAHEPYIRHVIYEAVMGGVKDDDQQGTTEEST